MLAGAEPVFAHKASENATLAVVVVKLASHPVAAAGLTHPTTLKAWAALAKAVQL